MDLGPLGVVGSLGGSPLAQVRADAEQASLGQVRTERRSQSDLKAEAAAGVGKTDGEQHEVTDRDADGRRLWEEPPSGKHKQPHDDADSAAVASPADADGGVGGLLDLTG